jgi:hypothetical protein
LHEQTDLFQIAPELISGSLSVKKSTMRDIQPLLSRLACATVTINWTIGDRDPVNSLTLLSKHDRLSATRAKAEGGNETPIILLAGPQMTASARALLLTACA